ncbi:glycosyltransferase family 2 protein [Blautia glucerasea]|uniref:glycosyltransferase family 2 protein n=1 Tax=Clostridia TaxID=186801 RepID=UPI00156FBED6|nr:MULTISPECIES: glycosyltransferase family 2 protein [Clostridia]NSD38664.1 glycosyltransferase family 2 protein [Blautia glucerasea]
MLFSIVIPVYNVEAYLDECLHSILSQTKQFKEDCEVLLIDDGSTDKSGEICDEYLKKYPETIRVFHNTNHGLLWTRRFGFKQVQGDYVINCDSDDLLEEEAIKKLNNIVKKYNYPDVVIYNHNSYDGKNKTIAFKDIFTTAQDCSVEKKEVLKEYLSRHSIVSVCGKMIKRTCIDVDKDYEKFGRISTGEDTLQSIEFFSNAKTFVYLNHVIYDYRCGSGMTGKFDENYYFTFKRIFEEIEKKKNNWELADFDKLFAVKVLQTAGRAITQSRYKKWESMWAQTRYLIQIREDKMFQKNILYLVTIKGKLQKDHVMLLKLLQNRMYILICLMLSVKNYLAGNKG